MQHREIETSLSLLLCCLFSYSKTSKRLEGVAYKLLLINHTACKCEHSHFMRKLLKDPCTPLWLQGCALATFNQSLFPSLRRQEIGLCSREQLRKMFANFYPDSTPEEAEEFSAAVDDGEVMSKKVWIGIKSWFESTNHNFCLLLTRSALHRSRASSCSSSRAAAPPSRMHSGCVQRATTRNPRLKSQNNKEIITETTIASFIVIVSESRHSDRTIFIFAHKWLRIPSQLALNQ